MIHKPILLKGLSLLFPHKICFENFNTQINSGSRIAIIGRNGSGKSTLLNIIQGLVEPSNGEAFIPADAIFGYVPQLIEAFSDYSGGQKFNEALSQVLATSPNILILDEPTNHLDQKNRRSLMRMLASFPGTLIMATHDPELIRNICDTLWHIDNEKITIFNGDYEAYLSEIKNKRSAIEHELNLLDRQKKEAHKALMKEQERAKKSDLRGQKSIKERKWPTMLSDEKARRAIETSGKKKRAIRDKREGLNEKLSELRLPEMIIPKFHIAASEVSTTGLVTISEGTIAYADDQPILTNISLNISTYDRIAIKGNNGSGKSTLIKAILGKPGIVTTGNWLLPKSPYIGYLDQNYGTLPSSLTVLEAMEEIVPTWSHIEIRHHLNDFLFRKNEEVNNKIINLSGGEKARLSLALIAAKVPKLLILDEITNNLDLETKDHIIQVLKEYPNSFIIISHDEDFLSKIDINGSYHIEDGYVAYVG